MTVIERLRAIEKIGTTVHVPFEHGRFFKSHATIDLDGFGNVSFGEDFGTLNEVRNALEWYVAQMGGKVKWKNE